MVERVERITGAVLRQRHGEWVEGVAVSVGLLDRREVRRMYIHMVLTECGGDGDVV